MAEPADSGRSPSAALTRVDFPTPFGPRMATNSPGATPRVTSDQMIRPPRRTAAASNVTTSRSGARPSSADTVASSRPGTAGPAGHHHPGLTDRAGTEGFRPLVMARPAASASADSMPMSCLVCQAW